MSRDLYDVFNSIKGINQKPEEKEVTDRNISWLTLLLKNRLVTDAEILKLFKLLELSKPQIHLLTSSFSSHCGIPQGVLQNLLDSKFWQKPVTTQPSSNKVPPSTLFSQSSTGGNLSENKRSTSKPITCDSIHIPIPIRLGKPL